MLLFDENLLEADEAAPLDEVEMERGDAFWFSPTWYQTVGSHAQAAMSPSLGATMQLPKGQAPWQGSSCVRVNDLAILAEQLPYLCSMQ